MSTPTDLNRAIAALGLSNKKLGEAQVALTLQANPSPTQYAALLAVTQAQTRSVLDLTEAVLQSHLLQAEQIDKLARMIQLLNQRF